MCLRLTVLAVPPVVPLLHADLHLAETGIGWLSSLPPMLFAIAAVPGSLLIARFGMMPALLFGLVLNAAGAAARGAIADAAYLYTSTIVMGAGISIVQTVMPALVRAWFPHNIGSATSVYTNGLLVGEIVPVAVTIPVVLPLLQGSWRLGFVFWSMPVLATALLFACHARRPSATEKRPAPVKRRWWPDWHDPLIWRLGLILGSVNATYFVTNAFLPDYVIDTGRPDLVSSALTAINLGQLPASFLMLPLADRLVTRPRAYALTGSLSFFSVAANDSGDGPAPAVSRETPAPTAEQDDAFDLPEDQFAGVETSIEREFPARVADARRLPRRERAGAQRAAVDW